MEEITIGIVGSRRRNDLVCRRDVFRLMNRLITECPHAQIVWVSGGCHQGADDFAKQFSRIHHARIIEHHVDRVGVHGRWDFTVKAHERNRRIAEDSQILFAFVHRDRTGGTENTVSHALGMPGKRVFLVDDGGRIYLCKDGDQIKCPDDTPLPLGLRSID